MGRYSDHWARYRKDHTRGTLQVLALVGIGLPAIALCGYALAQLTVHATPLQLALIVAWLAAFARLLIRASKVVCPRCGTRYTRGKHLSDCPTCSLRMMQDDD